MDDLMLIDTMPELIGRYVQSDYWPGRWVIVGVYEQRTLQGSRIWFRSWCGPDDWTRQLCAPLDTSRIVT
jgi:hypothetical protein